MAAQSAPPAVDTYFANEANLVAVFDLEYEKIIEFETQVAWARFLCFPPAWIASVCCAPCFLNANAAWDTNAQHAALTVDGIRFVKEKRKFWCGLPCSDKGKESKTVPYDKITDCDVLEPAGTACCCCIPNVLPVVHVDTASSGTKDGVPSHELVLKGLKYPNEFKASVWAMKRGAHPPVASVPLPQVGGVSRMSAPSQNDMTAPLLMEIRDELRTMNAHLQARK